MIGFVSRQSSVPVGKVWGQRLTEIWVRRPPQLCGQLAPNRLEPTEQFRRCLPSERIVVFDRAEQHVLAEILEFDEPATRSMGAPQRACRCVACHQSLQVSEEILHVSICFLS